MTRQIDRCAVLFGELRAMVFKPFLYVKPRLDAFFYFIIFMLVPNWKSSSSLLSRQFNNCIVAMVCLHVVIHYLQQSWHSNSTGKTHSSSWLTLVEDLVLSLTSNSTWVEFNFLYNMNNNTLQKTKKKIVFKFSSFFYYTTL